MQKGLRMFYVTIIQLSPQVDTVDKSTVGSGLVVGKGQHG